MKQPDLPEKSTKGIRITSTRGAFYKFVSDAYLQILGAERSSEREEVSALRTPWEFPESQVADDIAELKQTALDIVHKNQRIIELLGSVPSINRELAEIKTIIKTKLGEVNADVAGIDKIVREYVGLLEGIEIARQIYLFKSGGCNNLWTVIDAPPFEDDLRYPIYEAQMNISSRGSKNNPVDFYIININELPEGKRLEDILPINATLIWKCE